MKKPLTLLCLLFASVMFTGCDDDEKADTYDVYTYGTLNRHAAYWKNGELHTLTDGTNYSDIRSGFYSGSDFYVAGVEVGSNGNPIARYWKNGVAVSLSDGTKNEALYDIAVSGADVHAVGVELRDQYAVKYWKNGVSTLLTDGSAFALPLAMAVSGSDVHIVGVQNTPTGVTGRYWKNGTLVNMSINTEYSAFTDIAISGSDVHIIGQTGTNTMVNAKYWKNGVEVALENGGIYPAEIQLSGDDVYIIDSYLDIYWKNGVAHDLPSKTSSEYVSTWGIDVYRDNVFVAANRLNPSDNARLGAYLWKNNEEQAPFLGDDASVILEGVVLSK